MPGNNKRIKPFGMQVSLNWDNLKIVLAISRTGSLARSAVLLDVDQSTASRKLAALEGDLGTSLFVRSSTGLVPTEAGNRVIERAAEIEHQIHGLNDEITDATGKPQGLIRVLANGWVLNLLSNCVIPEFLAEYPGIDLRLIHLVPQTPVRGEATVSLWFEVEPRPGEFTVPLGDVHYATYAAADKNRPVDRWVSFHDEDAPPRAPHRMWDRIRDKDDDRLQLTSTDARDVLAGVEAGIGKGILPICLAESSPKVVSISEKPSQLVRQMFLHAHPDTAQTRRVQALIRTLRAKFDATFSRPDG